MRDLVRPAVVPVALTLLVLAAMPAAGREARGPAIRPLGGASSQPAGSTHDLLPNLRMARPYGLRLARPANGKTVLRFGTIAWNVGQGPLEVIGQSPQTGPDGVRRMSSVRQRVYEDSDWDGDGDRFRGFDLAAEMFYSEDGHDHWHLKRFMTLELYDPAAPDAAISIRKLGYCLIDFRRMQNPPPNAVPGPVYPLDACGKASDTRVRTGLSIGYGDDYPPNFAHQWIDVTGLPAGVYRLCATVNQQARLLESSLTENYIWVDLAIDVAAGTVTEVGRGREWCRPGVAAPPGF